MAPMEVADTEGARCEGSPEATAVMLGLDRGSGPAAYPVEALRRREMIWARSFAAVFIDARSWPAS